MLADPPRPLDHDTVGRRVFRLPGLLALLLLAGCGGDVPATGDASDPRTESTRRMAERLAQVAAEADPSRNPYLNEQRIEMLARSPLPADPTEALVQRGRLARELLHAGRTEDAVDSLARLLERATTATDAPEMPRAVRRTLRELLAVGHLHLALKANCIEPRRSESCLAPPPDGAVHPESTSARAAARHYRKLIDADSDDQLAMWLLNLAAMQAGAWPGEVAAERRVPASAFVDPEAELARFRDVGPEVGIDVLGHAGGSVLDDLDGDGDLDVMVSSRGLDDQLRYFSNEGDGTFTERTHEAGLEGLTGGLNLVQGDYDNDGHLDVLVLRGAWLPGDHPNSLLRNQGDGTFEDVTVEAGLDTARPTQTAAWADFDGDGHIDLYVGNETTGGERHPSELFRNDGDGTFTEMAAEAGVDVAGFVKAVVWGDVDDDGRPDLYVSRLGEPNHLYLNRGPDDAGSWRFEEVGGEAGVREPVDSFPAWFWDYDDDGDLDLFVAGYRVGRDDVPAEALGRPHDAETPRLYRNRGDGTFEDVTRAAGLDRIVYAMGSNFGDLDGDGFPDFYAGTGEPDLRALMPSRAFVNRPTGPDNPAGRRFLEVTAPGGLGHIGKGHGISFGDVDRDGDQDVLAVFGGAYEGDVGRDALFLNPGPRVETGHAWLTLRLVGTVANRAAIGARVAVTIRSPEGIRVHHATVGSGGSFGASSLQLEMGLGDARAVEQVEIRWPGSGRVERLEGLELRRTYRVREGEGHAHPVEELPLPMGQSDPDGSGATSNSEPEACVAGEAARHRGFPRLARYPTEIQFSRSARGVAAHHGAKERGHDGRRASEVIKRKAR